MTAGCHASWRRCPPWRAPAADIRGRIETSGPDHRLGRAGEFPVLRRLDHRRRGAATHAGHVLGDAGSDRLGHHLLYRRLRTVHSRCGMAELALRPQARLPVRGHCFSRRLGRMRRRQFAGGGSLRAHRAGPGRRLPNPAVARHHPRYLSAGRAGQGHGAVGHGRGDGLFRRTDAGRLRHRVSELALHFLHQRSLWCARAGRCGRLPARDEARSRAPARLVRLSESVARHRVIATHAGPRRATRLVRILGDHHRSRSRGAGPLSVQRA